MPEMSFTTVINFVIYCHRVAEFEVLQLILLTSDEFYIHRFSRESVIWMLCHVLCSHSVYLCDRWFMVEVVFEIQRLNTLI